MTYVALLRGVNVGGKNKIDMKLLKETFVRAGMDSVITYINSGNIIFTNEGRTKTEISALLEKTIFEDFNLQIKVLIRSMEDFESMIKVLPASWKNDDDMKGDVLFLWDEVNQQEVHSRLVIKPGIDNVLFAPGVIMWSVERENVTKSGLMKLAGTDLYKNMTVRNVNTARRIYEIMQQGKNS